MTSVKLNLGRPTHLRTKLLVWIDGLDARAKSRLAPSAYNPALRVLNNEMARSMLWIKQRMRRALRRL